MPIASWKILVLLLLDVAHIRSEETEDQAESGAQLTDDQLRQVHAELDENNDKEASKQELTKFVDKHKKDVAYASIDAQGEVERMDTSGDGKITLDEYLADVTVMTEKATGPDDIDKFKAADTDGDGFLTKAELHALLAPETHDGMVNVTMQHSFRNADSDQDGKISQEEFTDDTELSSTAVAVSATGDTEVEHAQASKELFKRLDKDGDGYIQLEELRPVANGAVKREHVVSTVVKTLDKDGDLHVDSSELVQAKEALKDNEIQKYLIAWAKRRQTLV